MANEHIKVFSENSPEREQLNALAYTLNEKQKKYTYTVEECYFDAGQGWLWTTLIQHDPARKGSILETCQALTPRQQKEALFGDVLTVIDEMLNKANEK